MNKDNVLENNKNDEITCVFCNRKINKSPEILFFQSNISKSSICSICAKSFFEASEEFFGSSKPKEKKEDITLNLKNELNSITPQKIKEQLDEYIIGQEHAKKALSIAAYSHYVRCLNPELNIEKTNVLLCGPTGCGKTFMVETLSKIMQVPFVSIDITGYSETGYKGKDVEDIIVSLVHAANGNIEKAKNGIVFIDEIDKLSAVDDGKGISDVKVQSSLLKIIDGVKQSFGEKENINNFDTSNILFIFAGAFAGMEKIKKKKRSALGFLAIDIENQYDTIPIEQKDLIEYGLLPELVGRMHRIVELNPLSKEDLMKILKFSKKSVCKQYISLMKASDITLNIEDSAYEQIANIAINTKLGARALRGIVDETLEDYIYNIEDSKSKKNIEINKDLVKTKKES